MQCCVCRRSPSSKLSFNCATCARNTVYHPRLQLASILLKKATAEEEVNKIITGRQESQGQRRGQHGKQTPDQTLFNLMDLVAHEAEIDEQLVSTKKYGESLRQKIEQQRSAIEAHKNTNARRKADIEAAKQALSNEEGPLVESLGQGTKRTEKRWNHLHERAISSRGFLCREAANLYGLRQRRRKRSDGSVKEEYKLGSIAIVGLRELNSTSPAKITASLNNIAHLLALVSHYLALRLPAELTLPHKDYPLPTIFPPSASYQSRSQPFPGYSPTHSVDTSLAESRGDLRPLARPRPLYIDKALPLLAKDDPAAYSFFVEGVTYLAWDVAWVCRTQGLDVGAKSWEDVCSMGRNLWLLLVTEPSIPSSDTAGTDINATSHSAGLGYFSHGSSHTFLGGAEGIHFMKSWQLQSPMKLIDQVKSCLLSDMAGAEWEVVEEKEWEEHGKEANEEGVLINGVVGQATKPPTDDQSSNNGTTQKGKDTETDRRPSDKSKGWTKLKSRAE